MQRAFVVIIAILVVGATDVLAQAEPWLQYGYDPGRTGTTLDGGPETHDVAFQLDLRTSNTGTPIILGGYVYILGMDLGHSCCVETGVYRIALDAGGPPERVIELERGVIDQRLAPLPGWGDHYRAYHWGTDGTLLFITQHSAVRAYALDGALEWEYPFPEQLDAFAECIDPAVHEGVIYLNCWGWNSTPVFSTFVFALDSETGDEIWKASLDPDRYRSRNDPGPSPGVCNRDEIPDELPDELKPLYETCPAAPLWISLAISVVGNQVVATAAEGTTAVLTVRDWSDIPPLAGLFEERFFVLSFQAFDLQGRFLWGESNFDGYANAESAMTFPIGTERSLFYRLGDHVYSVNPTTAQDIWPDGEYLGPQDAPGFNAGGILVLDGETLFVAATKTLFRLDDAFSNRPTTTVLAGLDRGSDQIWSPYGAIATNRHIYLTASWNPDPSRLYDRHEQMYVFDRSTRELEPLGEPTQVGYAARLVEPAIGHGVLVLAHQDGRVVVYGATAASIQADASLRSLYPKPGEPVTVDMSASGPGVHGPPTMYRADWGDGTDTDWQPSPILTHHYTTPGPQTARFQAGNDAGQTASTFVTFDVGGTELNMLQRAFAPGNIDTTLGVLGLLLVLLGALFGAARLRQRRSRLQRELEAIQSAYDENRAKPARCEAVLDERRHHLTRLLKAGKLDEAQVSLLERRIDDLVRNIRFSAIHEGLDFLPLGLVKELRGMLEDGRVSAIERDHVQRLLEADKLLTRAQKVKVRKLVESWFEVDVYEEAAIGNPRSSRRTRREPAMDRGR